jgi:hypothetical protein
MARFFDPALFPHDLMADYFSAVSPPAYTALHWLAAVVFGVDPFVLNKLLPIVLGVLMTGYAFRLTMRLLPVPAAAFAATTLLNQTVWLGDAIPSGTPRAFVYPLFLALLDYFVGRRYGRALGAVVLLGLFYPQMLAIAVGTVGLSLLHWQGGRLQLSRDRRLYLLLGGCVVAAALIVGWAAFRAAPFGPVVTADQARAMIEFTYSGRSFFFTADPFKYWVWGERSGFAPFGLEPRLIWVGLLLPVLARYPAVFPLTRQLSPLTSVLVRVVLASIGMFGAAHLLLFRLHLPSRYTQHSFRIVLAIAAGIVLLSLLDSLWR